MDYGLTEEQRMVQDTAREIADDYDQDYWREHVEEQEFPEEYWDDLAEYGLLGTAIPEEYGGAGMGMQEMAIAIEELSRGGGQGGVMFVLTPVFGGISVEEHGSEEQKEEYLSGIADGETKFCMGLTEARAGTNTLNMDTDADKDGDEYVVNGQKMFISGVDNADTMLLPARTSEYDSSDPLGGISLFLVDDPADRDAISLSPVDVKVPWYETQFQVDIDDLKVEDDQLLGHEDGGMYHLFDTLNTERIAGAASAIGGGLRAVDLAVDYANDREVFGQPIGAHQAIQHPLADAYADLIAAREVTRKAAWKWDQDEDASMESNVANLLASEAAFDAADRAVQTHGGNGFTAEYEVYDIWQNMRLLETVPITNEMVKNFISENHMGLPRSY